ncbi:galactokinase [Rothia terrae]|uniref:galactokinase n=1 Tax=Rothia terrae TaxID=396015 RepID=UPI0014460764|nr:galactokinase [Rothia terrae]NKZ33910.1 galactokinase [Rothia terrae]
MTELVWKTAQETGAHVARVRQAFIDEFGYEPARVFSAPGRVNLIGEHIDYNGGIVMPLALPHRTFVAISPRTDGVLRVTSTQDGSETTGIAADAIAPGAVDSWIAYVVGVPWAMRELGLLDEVTGADIAVDSDVPLGAGLSSSAALECSVALAFDALASGNDSSRQLLAATDEGRKKLATACIKAENEIAGANTGGMDQSISLRASQGSVLTIDCRDFATTKVPLDLAAAGLSLLVIDTRAPHQLNDGQYAKRRAGCDAMADAFGEKFLSSLVTDGTEVKGDVDDAVARWREIASAGEVEVPGEYTVEALLRHVLSEQLRVVETIKLFEAGEPTAGTWSKLGELLTASHASLRDDYQVTCPELDVAVDVALEAGALGARMTGGGFGGSAVALVRAGEQDAVAHAVREAFASRGFNEPHFLSATPEESAREEF